MTELRKKTGLLCAAIVLFSSSTPTSFAQAPHNAVSQGCDSFCDYVARALRGWNTSKDRWCADHGHPTDAIQSTVSRATQNALTPLSTDEALACPYLMLDGDRSCQEVQNKLWACKLKQSNVGAQCVAYQGIELAEGKATTVRNIEAGAALVCGLACGLQAVPVVGQTAITACMVAGGIAVAGEIAALWDFDNDAGNLFTDSMQGLFAGTGVGAGIVGVAGAGTSKTLGPCVAAGAFAALVGLRNSSLGKNRDAKTQACSNVMLLAANLSPPDGKDDTDDTGGSGSTGGLDDGTGSSGTGGSGGTNPWGNPTVNLPDGAEDDTSDGSGGVDWGDLDLDSATASGKMLADSGLWDLMKKNQSELSSSSLSSSLDKNDFGGAFGSFGGKSLGKVGEKLADIAKISYDNPQYLEELLGGQANSIYSAKKSSAGSDDSKFKYQGSGVGRVAYNKDGSIIRSGGAQEGVNLIKFGAGRSPSSNEAPADIWHKGTSLTLFQIVSERIEKTTPRLRLE